MNEKIPAHVAEAHKAIAEKIGKIIALVPESTFEDNISFSLYSCDRDADRLVHMEPYEAVDEWIANQAYDDGTAPLPAEVTVYEWKPTKVRLPSAGLDAVVEEMDEEYGDPEDSEFTPTPLMRAVEDLMCEVILRQYRPWMCDFVGEHVVSVS